MRLGDLAAHVDAVSDRAVDSLIEEYRAACTLAPGLDADRELAR